MSITYGSRAGARLLTDQDHGVRGAGLHPLAVPNGAQGEISGADKAKIDQLSTDGGALVPSGGDDLVALQAAFTSSPTTPAVLKAGAIFLISAALSIPSGARILSSVRGKVATIRPTAWAPAVSSANDASIAMLTSIATVAGSGTTLARAYRGNDWFIEVASAAALSLVGDGTDVIRIYSSIASAGDFQGDGGSERYDVVGVKSVAGNFLFLQRPLYCFHASGALVRAVTTPATDIKIRDVRLDASGGSIPVLLRLDGVTDSEIGVEVRGASHAAAMTRFGCARLRGEIVHDGECNSALMSDAHDSEGLVVRSTGQGKRFHRNGVIRGLVHCEGRSVRGPLKGHRLRGGVTGVFLRGTILGRVDDVTIDDMDLSERVRRPIGLLFTVTTATDVVNLFANNAGDGIELREGDRVMVAASSLPAPLTAQTVYYARDVTNATCKLALTKGGAAIDLTTTGAGFGAMILARYMVVATAATDVIACAGHDFVNGDEVRFVTLTGLNMPGGILNQTSYFVRDVIAGVSFRLSATQGGSLLDITSAGDGFTYCERYRCDEQITLTRSGLVKVAAAGVEINDGNPSVTAPAFRNIGLTISNTVLNCCKVPDVFGNQASLVMIDTVNVYTSNVTIANEGRTDSLAIQPPDGHIFGALFWDNYACKHDSWLLQGIEQGLIFVGGWNTHAFDGLFANGRDGQSNVGWFIRNGMESAASAADTDIQFNGCEISGYTTLITAHLSSWFSPADASWQRFRASEFRLGSAGNLTASFRDVRCLKNLTGATVNYGDVVALGEFTGSGASAGIPCSKATIPASDDPEALGVAMWDGSGGVAANGYFFAAFGDCVAKIKTGDTPAIGAKLFAQAAGTLTTTAGASRAFGAALSKGDGTAGKLVAIKRR